MQLATAILVLLSHAGYWVGGQDQTIELRWPVEQKMPDAVVIWNLSVAKTTLAEGKTTLAGADGKATLKVAAPKVRAATDLLFTYRIVDAANADREISSGNVPVRLFPDRLADLAAVTVDIPLLVIDTEQGLPAALKAAGVKFDRADDLTGLATANQKLIVVGENRLAADDPAAAAIQALARGGASVLVLRQTAGPRVLQYDVAERDVAGYVINTDHALLRHLPADAWKTLLADPSRQPTLAVSKDRAALELVHSPIEAATVTAAPLDVLLLSESVGDGREVFCQLPLDHVATDARQQQLLINLVEYAKTRPQPTPPRAERLAAVKKPGETVKSQILGE